MTGKRLLWLLALSMIGEGIAGLLRPRRSLLLWQGGPRWYRTWIKGLAKASPTVQLLALAELGGGLWLLLRVTEANEG